MIHSQVQACNIGTMGFKVICAPKLKTIPNQDPRIQIKRGKKMWTEKWKFWSSTPQNILAAILYFSSKWKQLHKYNKWKRQEAENN